MYTFNVRTVGPGRVGGAGAREGRGAYVQQKENRPKRPGLGRCLGVLVVKIVF